MARGKLRIYLGAAPGVGKTYKMLEEGHRRLKRGSDVVVGLVETHGRARTAALLEGLEVLPRKTMSHRGSAFTELDVEAVLLRSPDVVLIDELAHTNVPGSPHAKRWEDIHEILDAGITVLSTVNIQHLESLNDVVAQITGVPQRETVPDDIVRAAEQVELVDMTPEALRRRMIHGNVYPPEKIDASLSNYFRPGNLTALRELALLWLADKVDEQLENYRSEHGIADTWEARERVVVALTGGAEGDTLIRRAARIADRSKGAELVALHVARSDGLSGANPANLARQRALVESLGGYYRQVVGDNIPAALLDFARGVNATQLVLGASRRGRFARLFSSGVGISTTAASGSIDVHLVTHEQVAHGLPALAVRLPTWRRWLGIALAAILLPLLTFALAQARDDLSLSSNILLFLLVVLGVAAVSGLVAALVTALAAYALLNYYFVPPLYTWRINQAEDLLALGVFLLVAVVISVAVNAVARRSREAARASAEAETLSTLAGSVLRGERALPALLERVRETFHAASVTLVEQAPDAPARPGARSDPTLWSIVATAGGQPCGTPDEGDTDVQIDDQLALVLRGVTVAAVDRRALEGFAAHIGVALRQQRLAAQAATAESLAEVDQLRTALLNAVSHDLRTPLASAKAAVEGLRNPRVVFTDDERAELLATADESLDRLDTLVANLLDMSRLQSGALGMFSQAISVEEVIPRVIDALDLRSDAVEIHTPEHLPDAQADPALLERIIANVLSNALRYSPEEQPPAITTSAHDDVVEIRIIDYGPGIPPADRERVFAPFQRLGDRDNETGVGLGLALSRGLAEAMGGTLTPEETPGGGLTMTLSLPIATPSPKEETR